MKEGLFARTGLQCNELLTKRYDSIECDTHFNVKADEFAIGVLRDLGCSRGGEGRVAVGFLTGGYSAQGSAKSLVPAQGSLAELVKRIGFLSHNDIFVYKYIFL